MFGIVAAFVCGAAWLASGGGADGALGSARCSFWALFSPSIAFSKFRSANFSKNHTPFYIFFCQIQVKFIA